MKRAVITIENGMVSVPQSDIRMTAFEIAALFEIYTQTINSHIKAVLKSDIIKVDISCPVIVAENTLMPDVYGLDMITALAFRVHSPKAEAFREWVVHRITTHFNTLPATLFFQLSKRALLN
jgi:hypothetical protein